MGEIELHLKELIIKQYGSLKRFCDIIDMPWSTLDSILKRGICNSNITNVLKITKELDIDTESLISGKITQSIHTNMVINKIPQTIAAHFDGDEYTEDELDEIKKFAEFVKARRN